MPDLSFYCQLYRILWLFGGLILLCVSVLLFFRFVPKSIQDFIICFFYTILIFVSVTVFFYMVICDIVEYNNRYLNEKMSILKGRYYEE